MCSFINGGENIVEGVCRQVGRITPEQLLRKRSWFWVVRLQAREPSRVMAELLYLQWREQKWQRVDSIRDFSIIGKSLGAWLALAVEHVTLHLGVVSSSPMVGAPKNKDYLKIN